MSSTISGSCLCSCVQYEVTGELESVVNCHCNTCRKMTGSAFSFIALIEEQNFAITAGRDKLEAFSISDNATKHFCRQCGSPVYNVHKEYPGHLLLPVGTLEDPAIAEPALNIFCKSMLPWVKEISNLKSFDQLPQK